MEITVIGSLVSPPVKMKDVPAGIVFSAALSPVGNPNVKYLRTNAGLLRLDDARMVVGDNFMLHSYQAYRAELRLTPVESTWVV